MLSPHAEKWVTRPSPSPTDRRPWLELTITLTATVRMPDDRVGLT